MIECRFGGEGRVELKAKVIVGKVKGDAYM
jgi:hypothetical protein